MNKLKIKDIVYSVSETHPFNFEKLYAINTSDVFQGKIINTTMISTDELKGQFKKTIQSNDILFSEIRPINKHFAKVNLTDTKRYVVSTKLMVLRKHNINVDLDYFYYCLTNNVFLKILQSRAENRICSFPQITFDLLGEYSIPIPEMRIQKQIAKTIKNIDSKIEFNNKINDELENMAKTIYDYWFLQFEFPNEEGKPYKSSGGKMVWNEELKREIPEDWEVNKLEEYISVIRGVNYKRDDVLSNKEINYIPLIKSNNIQNGQILFDDIIFVPQKLVNKNQILSKNSVLMTMSSGSKEHMGKTTIIYDSLDYTFGAFCSKIEIIEDMRCFLSIFFRSALFKTLIDNITSGTNINNISNEHLYNINVLC